MRSDQRPIQAELEPIPSAGAAEVAALAEDVADKAPKANPVFTGTVTFDTLAPTTKPTVTGSRGGNAALASLLTGLAGLGVLTDSTTA